jgi:hypothetical protein
VGIAFCAVALVISLALLARALDWPVSFPQFLAYAGAAMMLAVAIAFGFWTYSCVTMRYFVDGEGVSVRWGPVSHRVATGSITGVDRGRAESKPRIHGVGWPGYHVGRGEVAGIGETLFFSTHRDPEELVYVRTATLAYAFSPRDPDRFVGAIERARKGAGPATSAPLVDRGLVAAHPIWQDRVAQALVLVAVVANAALWGFVLAVYPDLGQEIRIEFPPVGEIATLQSKEEILQIPATASALLAVNVLGALVFHPRERAATYLLLSGGVFFQAVFWLAAVVAVVNA